MLGSLALVPVCTNGAFALPDRASSISLVVVDVCRVRLGGERGLSVSCLGVISGRRGALVDRVADSVQQHVALPDGAAVLTRSAPCRPGPRSTVAEFGPTDRVLTFTFDGSGGRLPRPAAARESHRLSGVTTVTLPYRTACRAASRGRRLRRHRDAPGTDVSDPAQHERAGSPRSVRGVDDSLWLDGDRDRLVTGPIAAWAIRQTYPLESQRRQLRSLPNVRHIPSPLSRGHRPTAGPSTATLELGHHPASPGPAGQRARSPRICWLARRPGPPVTQPPGWVPEPHW